METRKFGSSNYARNKGGKSYAGKSSTASRPTTGNFKSSFRNEGSSRFGNSSREGRPAYKSFQKRDGDSRFNSSSREERPRYSNYNKSESTPRFGNSSSGSRPAYKSYNREGSSGYKGTGAREDRPRFNSYNKREGDNRFSKEGNFNKAPREATTTYRKYGDREERSGFKSFAPRESRFSRPYRVSSTRGGGGGRHSRFSGTKINHERYIAKAIANAEPVSMYNTEVSYEQFKLQPQLMQNILKEGYENPTNIQAETIPAVLKGRDVLALASTGSGKTAAYLIPLLNKILLDNRQRCIVILPTRELAEQTNVEFLKFSRGTGLRSAVLIGGSSMYIQKKDLFRNPNLVVATPGRLKDLANQGAIKLNTFDNVVLDEVDRMLDMGFVEEIKELISKMKEKKQSVFLSATMSREAETIARELLVEPVRVQIATVAPQANVDQDIIRAAGSDKLEKLKELLAKPEFQKVLIFSRTKRGADRLSDDLYKAGFKADSIHGDKTQGKRSMVIRRFRENSIKILVATDVAARGLDIKDISHVINFDEPATYEDYIHRIGRTGRIGKKGIALTFVS